MTVPDGRYSTTIASEYMDFPAQLNVFLTTPLCIWIVLFYYGGILVLVLGTSKSDDQA